MTLLSSDQLNLGSAPVAFRETSSPEGNGYEPWTIKIETH